MIAQEKAKLDYAVELECNEPDTRHWRHIWCSEKNQGELALRPPNWPEDTPLTIPSILNTSVEKYATTPLMGSRPLRECTMDGKKVYWNKGPYEWKTYKDVHNEVQLAAQGLLGLKAVMRAKESGKQCVAAMLAETSAEWMIAAQACAQCGITITTIYTTLGHEAMLHGLCETEAPILFLDWALYETLSEKVIKKAPALENIILIGRTFLPLENYWGHAS